ncbi:NACHT domain-containing protein [Actinoplanes sp. CA-142083]|uniref:NACHT domain-containing protein n=1 Tax=Actinoplanes sp. CA-142083 TaxID=3239903 RepID=UPI003D8A15A3
MRPRQLSYADAARLLGSADEPVIRLLGAVTGAAATAVTLGSLGGNDLFALRGELIKWGNDAVSHLRERVTGVRRFDRTQRLVAAHAIVVVTAFYEALDVDLTAARLTAGEQVAIATSTTAMNRYADWVGILVDTPLPIPAPHRPFEATVRDLEQFFENAAAAVRDFLGGLSAFEGRDAPVVVASEVRRTATDRYTQAYRRLITQAPEFGVWAGMVDAQATRTLLRETAADLSVQLAGLRAVSPAAALDAVVAGLGKRYRAGLETRILGSTQAPAHVVLPSLGDSYVNPRGRTSVAGPRDLPATEAWWQRSSVVDDVQGFLLAHLTGPEAVMSPLVVLGQPGSGKSAMTRVLAARLPAAEFLVIRVELRNVPADSSIQTQIEESLLQMLGERVSWPDLARRAGAALPVVILDGFDELLQATGMNRADYLELIKQFQQREEELDRPVAVLVTSRTVVADRARFPDGTVVLRLEPFDEPRVRAWVGIWNAHNAASLTGRDLHPLSAETVLSHGELAGQPLLLLLLALYDAGANALRSADRNLGRVDLYERLFADFIEREVVKQHGNRTDDRRRDEVDAEWRRLSAVALASLNRGGDVILEAELNEDLPHLLWEADLRPALEESADRALSVSQMMVGRFFFVHESRAARDTGGPERSFEFLHATFGDFLAARQIVASLVDVAEERLHQRRRQGVADPGPLYAITSFVTIARRAPLWEFCRGLLGKLGADKRRICRELALDLLPEAGYAHPTWTRGDYEPRRTPLATRHAAFSANLVCFVVLLSDKPVDAAELVGEPVVDNWRRQALLWQCQLDGEDAKRMWQTLRVAWRLDTDPTRLEVRAEDGTAVGVYESLPWPPYERPATYRADDHAMLAPDVSVAADGQIGRSLRRSAFVQTGHDVRECLYDLMPYWRNVGVPGLHEVEGEPFLVSEAALFFDLLLSGTRGRQRAKQYAWAFSLIEQRRQRDLLIRQLADDASRLPADDLVWIFEQLATSDVGSMPAEFLAMLSATARRETLALLNAINWDFSPEPDNPVRAELIRLYQNLGLEDPFTLS